MTPEQRAEMVGRAQWLPGDWPDDIAALVDENHLLEAKLGLALEQVASLKQHAVDLGRLAADEACPACGGSMRFCECMDDPFAPISDGETV